MSTVQIIFINALDFPVYFILWVFTYLSTKYIDFTIYVQALMYGYRVYNRFDKMSLLITRSCFYHDEYDSLVDDDSHISSDRIYKRFKEEEDDENYWFSYHSSEDMVAFYNSAS